jgi:hypothetical protein
MDVALAIMNYTTREQLSNLSAMIEKNGLAVPNENDLIPLGISPLNRARILSQFRTVEGKTSVLAVTLALHMAAKLDAHEGDTEVCWTGPTKDPTVRLTWPALSELLLSAEKRILIVDYEINTQMDPIMDILRRKSESGVRLEFIIDRLDEKKDFLSWIRSLTHKPDLYDRSEDPNDTMSALHAKCVIVDDKVAFFGSANLTYHGMKGNTELNLIVRDRSTVDSIVRLFQELRSSLKKYDIG